MEKLEKSAREEQIKALQKIIDDYAEIYKKYFELIYAVGEKFPGENRHQTALRYILEAERSESGEKCDANRT